MNKFNFVDLFAGCGGLSEGFYQEKFDALTHVELDKYACMTLEQRMLFYGYKDAESTIIEKDITDEDILKDIYKRVNSEKVDVLIGGPPCQSFSTLGRAKDENRMQNDPRNFLFEAYVNILNSLKPKLFVFENVLGLLSATVDNVKIIELILNELGKNYNLLDNPKEMILNSVHYGVPQQRRRLIIIGVRKDLKIKVKEVYNEIKKTHYAPNEHCQKGLKHYVTVRNAISDLPFLKPGEGEKMVNYSFPKTSMTSYMKKMRSDESLPVYDHVARTHNDKDQARYHKMAKNKWSFKELLQNELSLHHETPRVFGNSYVVQHWDYPAKTIIAHLYKDGNQFIHPDYEQNRTLTAREAARLQSFPDDFEFPVSRTQQYKQIGNAVPPLLAKEIATAIKVTLKRIEEY